MLEARSLVRRYGDFTAVRDVSFTVNEGEILGMLGPNGAGKTTTLRMLTGYLRPTEGNVLVDGHDVAAEPIRARRQIGYLPENVALYPEMRVEEYLAYRGRLERMSRADLRRALPDVMDRCMVADVRRQIIGTLSKGYRQRVGLAAAILHGPRVLVLDEPTVGLDPKQIIAIRELIRGLGKNLTLLLSTHILPEVELLCNRVLIIDRGRIIDQGTPESLRERWRGNSRLRLLLKEAPAEAAERLGALAGVTAVHAEEAVPGRFLLDASPGAITGGADLRELVFRLAVERGWVLLELAEEKVSLEDIFVRLTTQDVAAESGGDPASPADEVAADGPSRDEDASVTSGEEPNP